MRGDKKERETILSLAMAAVMAAVGVFGIICGVFSFRISQIGPLASLGYVLGLSGIFFVLMFVCLGVEDHAGHSTKSSGV